jgi:hypothetical protein
VPKSPKTNLSESVVIGALRKCAGITSLAAKELGSSRQNIHAWIKRSEAVRAAIAEIEEENLDIGEGHLLKKLRTGEWDAVRYYLDRKGRKRGYGNSVSVGVDDAQAEAFVASLGGNIDAYRAALARLGVPASEIP